MDAKEILMDRGIKPARSLGQHFLIDNDVAARMVDYANVSSEDIVLEIGAGVGSVTEKLVQRAKKVYAVEKDKELCSILKERYGDRGDTIDIIEGDILKIKLSGFDKVVASIPFSLSSPITYKLLLRNFGLAVVLYQKEFAQKMIASPRSPLYGRLSVITQALADIEILEGVHRDAFYPSPHVKTAIVRLREKAALERVQDKKKFFEFVTQAFEHRRKMMRHIFKTRGYSALTNLKKRPEELSADEFAQIAQNI
jgi:16S rRNA (adenine1518-N6/adenine1519-N6)-dimethyltransferase